MRFLLALSVVLVHTGELWGLQMVSGAIAVKAFFIISGFYMNLVLAEKYSDIGLLKRFYANRALRLFPSYWVVLVASIIFSLVVESMGGYDMIYVIRESVANAKSFFLLAFTNIFIVGQGAVFFTALDPANGSLIFHQNFRESATATFHLLYLPQGWSLSLELLFYAMAPFLARGSTSLLVTLVAASLALRVYIAVGLGWGHDPWFGRFFPLELAFFILGMLTHRVYQRLCINGIHYMRGISWIIFPVVLLISFMYQSLLTTFNSSLVFEWLYLAVFTIALPFIFATSKHNRLDRWLGEFSYPLYIVHVLVIKFVSSAFALFSLQLDPVPWVVLLSLMSSYFLIAYIDQPTQKRYKWGRSNDAKPNR
ncbi:acyltransferase [Gammaproteobacteria bacterium]|nr:acyltransferase [Gammaproteobacteria bacterium]